MNEETFTIRQNLYDFLYLGSTEHRWSQVTQRMYWIDALCINQRDTSERNHQVAQMGNIYAGARRVHIWLGRTPDVHRISKLFSHNFLRGSKRREPHKMRRNMQLIGIHVLHNDYWNRAWVVQEIVLARRVVVSLNFVTLSLVLFCRRLGQHRLDLTGTPFQQFEVSRHRKALQVLRNSSLLSLLGRFRDKDCALPRDRVFSLLAMCHPMERISADYDNSWTDIIMQILAKTRHIPCICSAALLARSLMPPDPLKPADAILAVEPMFTFDITDVYSDSVNMLCEQKKYHSGETNVLGWSSEQKFIGRRICLEDLLRVVRKVMRDPEGWAGTYISHALSLANARSDTPGDASVRNERGRKMMRSLVTLLRVFLTSDSRIAYRHLFKRMETTLYWFNFAPGWYMRARKHQHDTITLRVSFSALAKASESTSRMSLCGWQGEKSSLTKEDRWFRQFSVYHPPDDR